MTDTTGSEPHDRPEETTAADEGAVAQESQDSVTEASSETERDYEFSDETLADDQPSEKPLRRSPFLPIAAALGGILLLGSVAWWQLTGGASFSLPPPISSVVSGDLSLPSLPTSAESKAAASVETVAVSPKTDSGVQKEEAAPAAEVPADTLGAQSSLSETPVPQVKPVESAPAAAIIPAPIVEAAPVTPPATPITTATKQTSADADRRIETLTARADNLQKALDQANQQVGQLSASLAAASTVQASATKEAQGKIDKLEQQLAATSRPAPAPASTPTESLTTTAPNVSEETADAPKTETAAPVKPKAVRKSTHKTSKPAAKPVSRLVLRAVSSGHAWVAKTPASTELTEVIVGDKVSGIGTVTAIEEHDGKWIVRGTKGNIQ